MTPGGRQDVMRQPKTDDLFEWTVSESLFEAAPGPSPAPDAPLPLPAQSASPTARRPSRRITWLLAGAVLSVLAAVGLGALWQQFRLAQELRGVVAREEQAVLAGDLDALAARPHPDSSRWFWFNLHGGRGAWLDVAPLPHPFAQPLAHAGEVQSVQRLKPDLVRVDVKRAYEARGFGALIGPYTLPQFYRRDADGWKRAQPPDDFWGETQSLHGLRLDWTYPAVDAAFVRDLAPAMDDLLTRACVQWACPPDRRFSIRLDPDEKHTYAGVWNGWPTRFLLIQGTAETLTAPSPHAAGLPADDAARRQLREVYGLRLLRHAYDQVSRERAERSRNPFWSALGARLAARLGVDSVQATAALFPEPNVTAAALWDMRNRFSDRLETAEQRALILLNRVLQDAPADAEARLFRALAEAPDATTWLAQGLGLTEDEARARWTAAEAPLEVALSVEQPPAYALYCAGAGLAGWSPGDEKPAPLLPASITEASPLAWSPDGRRLLIEVAASWRAVVDFDARRLIWVPGTVVAAWPRAVWVDNTRLAYIAYPGDAGPRLGEARLQYLDLARPRAARPTLPRLNTYALAPGGAQAAVVDDIGRLGVMPALGGEIRWLDRGGDPQWSPDGRRLAYIAPETSLTLKVADVASGAIRALVDYDRLETVFVIPPAIDRLEAVWSPDGTHLAFAASHYSERGPETRVGSVTLNGAALTPLWAGATASVSFPAYSPGGRWLSLNTWDGHGESRLVILDAVDGSLVHTLPGFVSGWSANAEPAWSPDGLELRLIHRDGLYRLHEPQDPASRPQRAGVPCQQAVARPSP